MKNYIGYVIGFVLVFIIGSSIYEHNKKNDVYKKSERLDCHKTMTSFERIYDKSKIKDAQTMLLSGNYLLSSSVQKAVYSESKLFDFIKLENMDKVTLKTIKSYVKKLNPSEDKLKISYYIYENDIKDPGKKTEKSKLYAGYVVFRFSSQSDELIYQSQIDFMSKQGADLPKSIECAIKSFITN